MSKLIKVKERLLSTIDELSEENPQHQRYFEAVKAEIKKRPEPTYPQAFFLLKNLVTSVAENNPEYTEALQAVEQTLQANTDIQPGYRRSK